MSQKEYPTNRSELNQAMESCYQFKDQSVVEYDCSVARYYTDLIQHLEDQSKLQNKWKLPDWVYDPVILEKLLPFQTTVVYLVYHDCGKPYCRVVDDEGKQHFPDHANVSKEVFDQLSQNHQFFNDDALVSKLIAEDMDVHLLKGDGVPEFSQRDTAATQLLAGLSELHSNATMFGGLDSVGFKSKWKNLNRRGKAIVKLWKEQSND